MALAGCDSKKITAQDVADCIEAHRGGAVVIDHADAFTAGIPGRVTSAISFNLVGFKRPGNEAGSIVFEASDDDAAKAVAALRHFDLSTIRIPGVDLSKLPTINAIRTGMAERHGRVIVLWSRDRKARSSEITKTLDACLAR